MKLIDDLEKVISLDREIITQKLNETDYSLIRSALYVSSPMVAEYFESIFANLQYKEYRASHGPISMNEALKAVESILTKINS